MFITDIQLVLAFVAAIVLGGFLVVVLPRLVDALTVALHHVAEAFRDYGKGHKHEFNHAWAYMVSSGQMDLKKCHCGRIRIEKHKAQCDH